MRTTSWLAGTILAVAACGGGDSGPATTANTQSATTTVESTGSLRADVTSANGGQASGTLNTIGASAQSIVTVDGTATSVVAHNLHAATQDLMDRIYALPAASGTCDCDASGCTFVDCGDDLGQYKMNGSIAVSGDSYTIDITSEISSIGFTWSWDYSGTVTITDTSIDGSLSGDGGGTITGQGTSGGATIDWSWDVDYNSVTLDGTGCPTGGSIGASVSYSAGSSQGQGGSYSGSNTVTFGPTCGEATGS